MKKRIILIAVFLAAAVLAAVCTVVIYNTQSSFTGEKTVTEDSYSLRFDKMNGEDSCIFVLEEGDSIAFKFDITSGRADITVGIDGEKPVYTGNNISRAGFAVTVPADGEYRITVKAKHASGSISLNVAEK